jgi:hypothetical protein
MTSIGLAARPVNSFPSKVASDRAGAGMDLRKITTPNGLNRPQRRSLRSTGATSLGRSSGALRLSNRLK